MYELTVRRQVSNGLMERALQACSSDGEREREKLPFKSWILPVLKADWSTCLSSSTDGHDRAQVNTSI